MTARAPISRFSVKSPRSLGCASSIWTIETQIRVEAKKAFAWHCCMPRGPPSRDAAVPGLRPRRGLCRPYCAHTCRRPRNLTMPWKRRRRPELNSVMGRIGLSRVSITEGSRLTACPGVYLL
jgi:hypothetical protein